MHDAAANSFLRLDAGRRQVAREDLSLASGLVVHVSRVVSSVSDRASRA